MIIYALRDPQSNEIRYVGKTVRTAHRRLRRHLAESYLQQSSTHKNRWLRSLLKLGLEPIIEILQECSSLSELAEAERDHIARLRCAGVRLTNATDGGDGVGGWHHSLASREKIRQALTGKPKTADHRRNSALGHIGRKATAATRAKLSHERKQRGYFPPPRYGADNHQTKLTDTERDVIKSLRGLVSQRELGRRFGVTHTAIGKIQRSDLRVREFPKGEPK